MANKFVFVALLILLINVASSHILIGRDLSNRKIFRTKSGGEFMLTKSLSTRQKRMIARELLRAGLVEMVARKLREESDFGQPGSVRSRRRRAFLNDDDLY